MSGVRLLARMVCVMIIGLLLVGAGGAAGLSRKGNCLVLSDGYVSEYAWCAYQEASFPADHPGHDFCIRGLLGYNGRFSTWLNGWSVTRIDLEKYQGPLPLKGVDLVVLDDVRQVSCESHEAALLEFVKAGGGLLVYAGKWGLGGSPKDSLSVTSEISNFRNTPIGKALPVEIVSVPDWDPLGSKPIESRTPVFKDAAIGEGIDTANWQVTAIHACKPRGDVLAELDGRPLISRTQFGKGRIVVYAGDDLGWVRQGLWSGTEGDANISKYSGTLWKRLAALAVGDLRSIAASTDAPTTWQKSPAFVHPDQPMNIQWGGYFYYSFPEIMKLWAKDLVTHSATVYYGAPRELGDAGVQGWESVGVPLNGAEIIENASTWMVGADGQPIENTPCYNNPKALELMSARVRTWAAKVKREMPWTKYGHMGDETQWKSCYCKYCKDAFRDQYGYELPQLKNDFSQEYLNQWIDYQLFKNTCIGRMYKLAGEAAKSEKPDLKMFASLPLTGGMCHGDDTFNTQAGFDVIWDHTYPGTMAISVGVNAEVLEDTAVVQGRPYVPILDLLQGFDSYDRAPSMPPAEYIREMSWQAIAHGIDSIGWFVYNAFFWNLPGTEAWDEAGRMADEVLCPLTPTLYEMRNSMKPVGLLYCYSQEAVDGLKELVMDDDEPWKGVIRWWSTHATQEAYEVLKYSQVPFNVLTEHRMLQGMDLPWKAIIIPYVEQLHPKSRAALEEFMAKGGVVYVGEDSTLDLPGIKKLPVSFDTKFNTWFPKDNLTEWNQRRARQYLIGPALVKAEQIRSVLAQYCKDAMVTVDDPQVVYNVREAGDAKYLFFINDHQINPVSPEMRKKRQKYNHFMLMPMEFPSVTATARVKGSGYLYPLLSKGAPVKLDNSKAAEVNLKMDGGDGKVFVILPDKITRVELVGQPRRLEDGIAVQARVLGGRGVIKASVPLKIDLACGKAKQTVYATTKNGVLTWTVPYLTEFPKGAVSITITDLASGASVMGEARAR